MQYPPRPVQPGTDCPHCALEHNGRLLIASPLLFMWALLHCSGSSNGIGDGSDERDEWIVYDWSVWEYDGDGWSERERYGYDCQQCGQYPQRFD